MNTHINKSPINTECQSIIHHSVSDRAASSVWSIFSSAWLTIVASTNTLQLQKYVKVDSSKKAFQCRPLIYFALFIIIHITNFLILKNNPEQLKLEYYINQFILIIRWCFKIINYHLHQRQKVFFSLGKVKNLNNSYMPLLSRI